MNIDEWLQWPSKSTDPGVNFVVLFLLGFLIIIALALGATILMNRPVPTDQLYAQTEQRVISANFPDTEKFMDAHLDGLLDAIQEKPPAYGVFRAMAQITEALYKTENLNNPLPPLVGGSEIAEGRYRDELIAQQRKTVDAPRTLAVFNETLGKAYLDFIATLPPIATSTPEAFSKCDEQQAFATFALIYVLPDSARSVTALMLPFFAEQVSDIGLFTALRKQLDRNVNQISASVGTTGKLVM